MAPPVESLRWQIKRQAFEKLATLICAVTESPPSVLFSGPLVSYCGSCFEFFGASSVSCGVDRPTSWMENPIDKDEQLLKRQMSRCLRCGDSNLSLMLAQPHYYRMWQVEPCHRLV